MSINSMMRRGELMSDFKTKVRICIHDGWYSFYSTKNGDEVIRSLVDKSEDGGLMFLQNQYGTTAFINPNQIPVIEIERL